MLAETLVCQWEVPRKIPEFWNQFSSSENPRVVLVQVRGKLVCAHSRQCRLYIYSQRKLFAVATSAFWRSWWAVTDDGVKLMKVTALICNTLTKRVVLTHMSKWRKYQSFDCNSFLIREVFRSLYQSFCTMLFPCFIHVYFVKPLFETG